MNYWLLLKAKLFFSEEETIKIKLNRLLLSVGKALHFLVQRTFFWNLDITFSELRSKTGEKDKTWLRRTTNLFSDELVKNLVSPFAWHLEEPFSCILQETKYSWLVSTPSSFLKQQRKREEEFKEA